MTLELHNHIRSDVDPPAAYMTKNCEIPYCESVSEPEVTLDVAPFFEVTVQCPDAEAVLLYM